MSSTSSSNALTGLAAIEINILDFQTIGSIDPIKYEMSLVPGADSRVSLVQAGEACGLSRIVIRCSAETQYQPLELQFRTRVSPATPYLLMGVAFARQGEPGRSYAGHLKNFRKTQLDLLDPLEGGAGGEGHAYSRLSIQNYCLQEESPTLKTVFSYALFVQRVPSGAIGIIDPVLEHDYEPSSGT